MRVKVATMERWWNIFTVQVPVPLHGAPQPAKTDPAAATAVSVTFVPSAYTSPQSAPHEIPGPVTRPAPLP